MLFCNVAILCVVKIIFYYSTCMLHAVFAKYAQMLAPEEQSRKSIQTSYTDDA